MNTPIPEPGEQFDIDGFFGDLKHEAQLELSRNETLDSVINNAMGMVLINKSMRYQHILTDEEYRKVYFMLMDFFQFDEISFLTNIFRAQVDPSLLEESREAGFMSEYQKYQQSVSYLLANQQYRRD